VLSVRRTTANGSASSAFAVSTGAAVVARSPLTGAELWRRPESGAVVLGAGPDVIHLLTGPVGARNLVTVDASTGTERGSFRPAFGTEATDWEPGRWQVADGFLAIERLGAGGDADPEAPDHYFGVETVLIGALGQEEQR
jgi:hypothetical protein